MSDTVKMENHYCPLEIYERPRVTKAETSKNHELKMEHISCAGQKQEKSSTALTAAYKSLYGPNIPDIFNLNVN